MRSHFKDAQGSCHMATSTMSFTPSPASLTSGTVPKVQGANNSPSAQTLTVSDAPLWKTDDAAWRAEVLKKVCKPCEKLIRQKEAADKSLKQLIEDNYELLAWGRDHYGKQGQRNTSTIGWQEWIRQNMPCSVRYVNQVMAEIESCLKPTAEDQPDDAPDDEPTTTETDQNVLPDDIPVIANSPEKIFKLLEREYIHSLEATFKLDTPQQSRNAIQAFAQRLCAEFIGDGKALVRIKLIEEEKRKKQ